MGEAQPIGALDRFRSWTVDHPRALMYLFVAGIALLTLALLALIYGSFLLGAVAIVAMAIAFWAATGAGLPGSSWSYYRRSLGRYQDWATKTDWHLRSPIWAVEFGQPPSEFQDQHEQLLVLRRVADEARQEAMRRDTSVSSKEWLLPAMSTTAEVVRALDALIAAAESTPKYATRLIAARDRWRRGHDKALGGAATETRAYLRSLQRMRPPAEVESAHQKLLTAVAGYSPALHELYRAIDAAEMPAVEAALEELARVEASMQEAFDTAYARSVPAPP